MKAFLAKTKCYNKCVKIAKTEAASKLKSSKKETHNEKLPQISPQVSGGTLQETPMLVRSVAAVSLTLVDTKESHHEDSSLEQIGQATLSPATTAANTRGSSRWRNSPEIAGLFRDFPLSTESTASTTTATSSLSYLVNAKQKVQQPSPPTGYKFGGVKYRARRSANVTCSDPLSQWNTDSEFLVTGDRHTQPYSRRKHPERSSSRLRNQLKWIEPKSNAVFPSGYALRDTKQTTADTQEWCSPLTSSLHSKRGNTTVKHSMPDRKSIHDVLSLVRTKLLPRETYRKRPVNEQQSTVTESTESDITPSLFDTTQDDITCSSLTSHEHGQDKSITTDSVEYETSTQECSTSAATSERNSTIDSEEFPLKSRALDYATVPEINPIAILTRYKDYFEGERLPELPSEMSGTCRDQDTLVESVPSNRSLECRQSRSTIVGSEECTVRATTSEGNSTIGSEDYPRKISNSSSVLYTGLQNTSASASYHERVLPDVSDSYQEQETPVESESYHSQECGHSRSTTMESGEYVTSERNSTIGSADYPEKSTTEFEDNAVSEINSSSAVQSICSNTVIGDREYAESTSEQDYSTIASADYPVKSNTDFEEYAVSEIASTCDTSNWQEDGRSSEVSDSCREQVESPPPCRAGSISMPLLDTRQQNEFIECSPRARRRHRDVTTTFGSDASEQSERHETSNCSLKQLPEDNIPDRSPEVTGRFTSNALSLPLLDAERRDYDFEHGVYETYHRIIGPTDSATFKSQDYDSPEKYSSSKKNTKKSSMKRKFFPQKLPKGNGALRERSVSVKSVRFITDSPSVPYQDEESTDDDGYYKYSRSTGCLHRGKDEYVTSATHANSSQCIDSRPRQSLVHRNEEYYPSEIPTPPIRHHKSEHHSINDSAPNQTVASHYYSNSNRDPECPKLKRKKKPSKHKHSQLHKHRVHSDAKVHDKPPEGPDFGSDGTSEKIIPQYSETAVRQEGHVEYDQRRTYEPHSTVYATRRASIDSSSSTHMKSVEASVSICASRDECKKDCMEPEELSLLNSRHNSFESEQVTNPLTESQTVSNSTSQKGERIFEGLQSKKVSSNNSIGPQYYACMIY